MTPRLVLALGMVVAMTSCARRAVTLHGQSVPPSRTAVAENMHRQIANAVDAGDGDIEVLNLRERMAVDPNNLDIRLRLAARYEANGFPEVALEHYRLVAERFADHEAAHLKLAQYLRSRGSGVEAGKVLERYLASHPGAALEVHAWSGIVHDEIGDVGAGERAHRAAIAKARAPQAYLHNNLGQNLLLQGRNAEATEQFQIAVRLDPRSAVARNNLGVALAAQPEEAVLHWQSIAGAATAHNNMAAVLIEQGRYPEARRHLQIALGYKPDSAAALRNLALVAELDGEPAALHPPQAHSFWKRFAAAMEKVFLTPDGKPAKSETASRGAAEAAARD